MLTIYLIVAVIALGVILMTLPTTIAENRKWRGYLLSFSPRFQRTRIPQEFIQHF